MTLAEFILQHENDDTSALLLARHRFPDIDIDLAVTTIECRRRLRRKVPSWYAAPTLLFPSRLAAEQCSSEETARVKAMVALSVAAGCCRLQTVAARPLPQVGPSLLHCRGWHGFATDTSFRNSESNSVRIADLTGGMGVDSWAFSQVFGEVLYNEMRPALAEVTRQNFKALGVTNVQFRCKELVAGDSTDKPWNDGKASLPANASPSLPANAGNLLDILDGFKPDVIYMDPARRAGDGRKVFRLADCQPDVLTLLPELMAACPDLLLKLSPMADITQLSRELPGLMAVTVVGADGECKELLLHVRRDYAGPYSLAVVENGAELVFDPTTRLQSEVSGRAISCKREAENGSFAQNSHRVCSQTHAEPGFCANAQVAAERLLFEPGKALAKTGRFAEIGSRFGLTQISASTHLYTADSIPEELRPFGKVFEIEEVLPLNNETFRSLKKHIPAAEITARNLPLTSDALRKKLGIASGGTQHLFGVRSDAAGNLLLVTTPKAEGE